jgi:preprotein translocase SecE subunit
VVKAKSNPDNGGSQVVRRIKASDSKPSRVQQSSDSVVTKKPRDATKSKTKKPRQHNETTKPGNYFVNSWRELKQTRWPNRRATWSLTLAVIVFSAFFAGLILLFDWIFNFVIKEVIL